MSLLVSDLSLCLCVSVVELLVTGYQRRAGRLIIKARETVILAYWFQGQARLQFLASRARLRREALQNDV